MVFERAIFAIFGNAVKILDKGIYGFVRVLFSCVEACSFDYGVASCSEVAVERCYDFCVRRSFFVYVQGCDDVVGTFPHSVD